jgi:hypothetical protein
MITFLSGERADAGDGTRRETVSVRHSAERTAEPAPPACAAVACWTTSSQGSAALWCCVREPLPSAFACTSYLSGWQYVFLSDRVEVDDSI